MIHGVVCYWIYEEPLKSDRHAKLWHLVESYAIDEDGHPLTTPSTGGGDREEWFKWTHKKVPPDDNSLACVDYEWKYIGGRAVTLWTMEDGVKLLDFHPPKFEQWMSVCFTESLKKLPNWHDLLENGYCLILETAQAAHHILKRSDDGE